MKKIVASFSVVLGLLSLIDKTAYSDDFLPVRDIKPQKLMAYDLPAIESDKLFSENRSLPSSQILVYNVFTADDNWSRDLNHYLRYYKLKHAIHFCNLTVKQVTTYAKWKVEGVQPWQSNLFKIDVEPQKCYIYYMDGDYSNEGVYLFTGIVIPRGKGQNILNSDTSKFMIR
ncbi:hypothetical protein SAMN02745130_03335 [Thiothrix eikelboomii]|uniref:Uncharacterized protein n=1 Tax=Thiothrix eikelboomii TaxID=92487 RepID=A0A1T4XR60_9GAMM|nr:hypothetical protein [Thiothrix eikelboomii]SKA92014.1 hypothetical protein SAMN02745130_03335 [Thiothrix eikelboomii]